MTINLYDIIQGMIVTSLVTSSGIYVVAIFFPKTASKFYSFLSTFLKLDSKKKLIPQPSDQQKTCTLCSICTGCQLGRYNTHRESITK